MSEENLDKKDSDEIVESEEISTSENTESDETETSPRRKFFIILGVVLLVFVLIGLYLSRTQ